MFQGFFWVPLEVQGIFWVLVFAPIRSSLSLESWSTPPGVTPLVAIMKDQVEQLQSMGILALVIGVDVEEDEEEAGKMDRLDCL